MSLEIGALVVSCSGRDADTVLAVIGSTKTHLVLADGRKRRIEKPKHKKIKHIVPLDKRLNTDVNEALLKGEITNKMLYSGIKKSLTETTV